MKTMKQDLRVVKTRKGLKNSLINLLRNKSFNDITVTDICDNALINRVTFYSHYQDKYDLFNQCIEESINELIENSREELDISKSKHPMLDFSTNLFLKTIEQFVGQRDLLLNINSQDNTMLIFMIQKQALRKLKYLLKTTFTQQIDINIDILASFIVGGVAQVLNQYISNDINCDIQEIKDTGVKFIHDIFSAKMCKI